MIVALGVMIILMAFTIGFTGLCSFGKDQSVHPVVTVDAHSMLQMEAKSVPYPVRDPDLGEGFTATSARRVSINKQLGTTVSWLTPNKGYLQLTQSAAAAEDIANGIDSKVREETGQITVAGTTLAEWTGTEKGTLPAWSADLGDVRLVFSGDLSTEERDQIITTVLGTMPLPGAQVTAK